MSGSAPAAARHHLAVCRPRGVIDDLYCSCWAYNGDFAQGITSSPDDPQAPPMIGMPRPTGLPLGASGATPGATALVGASPATLVGAGYLMVFAGGSGWLLRRRDVLWPGKRRRGSLLPLSVGQARASRCGRMGCLRRDCPIRPKRRIGRNSCHNLRRKISSSGSWLQGSDTSRRVATNLAETTVQVCANHLMFHRPGHPSLSHLL